MLKNLLFKAFDTDTDKFIVTNMKKCKNYSFNDLSLLCNFFYIFFSLLLSACLGGCSDSTFSTIKIDRSCNIENGKGKKKWDVTKKAHICEVVTCDAGFDNEEDQTMCQETLLNNYSLENDKNRKPCPTPEHSFSTRSRGLSSPHTCYACDDGYIKDIQGEGSCGLPRLGKYVDADTGTEKKCTIIGGDQDGFKEWIRGAASAANACPFSCNSGFVKNGRNCSIPTTGYYPDHSGVSTPCSRVGGDSGGFKSFEDNTEAVDNSRNCNFSCNAGFVKDTYACNLPDKGKYVDGRNTQKICTAISDRNFKNWIRGAANAVNKCPFSCQNSLTADIEKRSCGQSCNVTRGRGQLETNGTCNVVSCDAGYDNRENSLRCERTLANFYSPANDKNRIACPTPERSLPTGSRGLSSPHACYTCNAGYIQNTQGDGFCGPPNLGKYVNADTGIEKECTAIVGDQDGFKEWIWGAASAANACPFSCNTGYMKNDMGRSCHYPGPGKYVTSQGTENNCGPITVDPGGVSTWVAGKAASADACPFTCNDGYRVVGRACKKVKPKALALGEETSYVLLDNGEVEGWGNTVSPSTAIPVKVDLGTTNGNKDLSQAIASGYQHRCVILKDGNNNHGPVRCWGKNSYGQLGVGDNNDKKVPTNTIIIASHTVKEIALGGDHSCAILNNNTVKCWGRNNYRQIGGGSSDSDIIISGKQGNPLNGQTATHIALGKDHSCVLLNNGSVQCWGNNSYQQIKDGTPLDTGKTAIQIEAGETLTCAILNDQTITCWSRRDITINKNATHIATGNSHSCAILNDKTVYCWGESDHGAIGGSLGKSIVLAESGPYILRGTAHDPLDGRTVTHIAAGEHHTCAILETDKSVKCWGRNNAGQIIGAVEMKLGSDGQGQSLGESQVLTANSMPTPTALEADTSGKLCALVLSGGNSSVPWVVKRYMISPQTYNTVNNTPISDAIDNLIAAIGDISFAGTKIILSKTGTGNNKIRVHTDIPIFSGMSLGIIHGGNDGDCHDSAVMTPIALGGGSNNAKSKGYWVIKDNFTGNGDSTINFDNVEIDLGNSALTKEEVANAVVDAMGSSSWEGKQYKTLPYAATTIDGKSDSNDDCPDDAFCVELTRIFSGTAGNTGIPFADSDYEN